jgi:hypothetical protein
MTTLLNAQTLGNTTGNVRPFSVAGIAGPTGIDITTTTGTTDLAPLGRKQLPRLIICGVATVIDTPDADNLASRLSGVDSMEISINADANAVRTATYKTLTAGPALTGYVVVPESLGADVTVTVTATAL